MNVHKCNGLSDSSKRNDAFVSLLHSPSGETETRRSVWPNRSWIQLVLFLLFHAKVRACANASAWETCIEKSPRSLDERCKTKLRLCQSKHQDYSHILFYQNRSLEVYIINSLLVVKGLMNAEAMLTQARSPGLVIGWTSFST